MNGKVTDWYGFLASLAETVNAKLYHKSLWIATAESCTGGLLATILTEPAGSSRIYRGGISAYSNAVKTSILGIAPQLIETHGAVSQQVAEAMATQVQSRLEADLGVGITGVAGPGGGSPDKPVGTVWLGLCFRGDVQSQLLKLAGNRSCVRQQAARAALQLVLDRIG